MDIKDFNSMTLEEIQEFQKQNREKMERNRRKVKDEKERVRRWIARGKTAEDFVPGADRMDDEEFTKKLYELIYERK